MTDSHRDTKLKPEDFEAFMQDLEAMLDHFKVPRARRRRCSETSVRVRLR